MKGSEAQKILKCLTDVERGAFLVRVAILPEGRLLSKICTFLIETKTFSAGDLMRHCKINSYRKDACLEVLSRLLLSSHWLEDPKATIGTIFTIAKRLMWNMQYETSVMVITHGIKLTVQMEDFHWVIDFRELYDDFPEDLPIPQLDGMTAMEASHHLRTIHEATALLHAIRETRRESTAEEKRARLIATMEAAKQFGETEGLCKKAQRMYLKTMALGHALQAQHLEAIPYQKALVDLIDAHPEICIDPDHTLAKEIKALARLYQGTGRNDLFALASVQISGLRTPNLHAEYHNAGFRFPAAIGMPLDAGDLEAGNKACEDFYALLANESFSFSKQFIAQNLYWIAYFHFASGNRQALSKAFKLLNGLKRSDFPPRYFLAYQILFLMRELETAKKDSDWDSVASTLASLRNAKFLEELQGLDHLLDLIARLIDHRVSSPSSDDLASLSISPEELAEKLRGLEILNFFDIFAWLESKNPGCPMLEVFKHRANPDLSH